METKMIGNKIVEARKRVNISQAQLAEKLFISSQAVGKWERGESMPDITTFNRLAEVLGVDLNYFSENFPTTVNEINVVGAVDKQEAISSEENNKSELKWNMSQGNWLDADFSGLKNLQEKFGSSNMKNCKFVDSDLSGLLLKGNNIEGCDFSNSNLSKSQIQRSNISHNLYKNCLMKETEFSANNIGSCDFTGVDFTQAQFKLSNFSKNMLKDAIWNRTSFIGTSIDETTFDGEMTDCYFENCGFSRVTFNCAILKKTFFKNNKNLKRIKFVECQADRITYEFLKSGKADVSGIILI